jgi:hypothetical protein
VVVSVREEQVPTLSKRASLRCVISCRGDCSGVFEGRHSPTSQHPQASLDRCLVFGEVRHPKMKKVVKIFCGGWSTIALDSQGTVWAWGLNNYHQVKCVVCA